MQRLVYSPKVYAWVKTEDRGIVNLTPYVTGGRVDRKLDSVSSAELTIRNPRKRFTPVGDPWFRPMDPITIWMSRLSNYPVQVFTGYLDRSPYLQLHPGTVRIVASCTLKRLLHTYWDPALPYVNEFLAEYGWVADRKSGTLANFQEIRETTKDTEKLPHDSLPPFKDGSIGNLLKATLIHVGEWKANEVVVEALPKTIAADVQKIFEAFESESKEQRKELERFFEEVIGKGDFSGMDSGGGANTIEGVSGSAEALYNEAILISENTAGYLYGGGHGPKLSTLKPTARLDCSGACSLALYRASLLNSDVALTSGGFMNWGRAGKGNQFTVWANSGHMFIEFHNLGPYKRFDTGGPGGGSGAKVHTAMRSTAGFTPRHMAGF
jgi:hypothetical protein